MCSARDAKKSARLDDDRARERRGAAGAEFAEQMKRRDPGNPDLQNDRPLEQHRQRVHRSMRGDECAQQNQRVKVAGLDIGEHRKAVVDVGIPEREMALAELVGQERDRRKLHAAEIPWEQIPGAEQRLMEKQDHVGEQGDVDPENRALIVHGEPTTVSYFPTC